MKKNIIFWGILFLGVSNTISINSQVKYKLGELMGMYSIEDTISIDETEIIIGEWMDYILYNNLKNYPSYIRMTAFTSSELNTLTKYKMDSSLIPIEQTAKKLILSLLPQKELKCIDYITYGYLGGSVSCLPVHCDSVKSKTFKTKIYDLMRYPITGISYEQAIKFCKWRTELDSLRFYDLSNTNQIKPKGIKGAQSSSYVFSLLTPEEYDLIIPDCDSTITSDDFSTFNYKNSEPPKKNNPKMINSQFGKSLVKCGEYVKYSNSQNRLLDIQGNAAEMTTIKGIAKGGSFLQYGNECKKYINNNYSHPEYSLGFRCCAKKRRK